MLFLVIDNDRWGRAFSIVRAHDKEEAKALADVHKPDSPRNEVIELPADGPPVVLWQDDDSPDTPRD